MKLDIVRAWKDEAYRQTLDKDLLIELPANPAGEMELSDESLSAVYGGGGGALRLSILNILTNIRLFSINVLASPLNQTCASNH